MTEKTSNSYKCCRCDKLLDINEEHIVSFGIVDFLKGKSIDSINGLFCDVCGAILSDKIIGFITKDEESKNDED